MTVVADSSSLLPQGHSAGMGEPDLIQGGARRDEERFVILAPEADVGRFFGHLDGLEFLAVGIIDLNLSMGEVEVALHVHRHAVASLVDGEQLFPEFSFLAYRIAGHGIGVVVILGVGVALVSARVGDVKSRAIGRKDNAVGHGQVLDQHFDFARFGVQFVDPVTGDFMRCPQAPWRIRKPEGTVLPNSHVVGRVEAFAFELFGQDLGLTVLSNADDVPCRMLTRDDAPLQIENVSVGLFALAEYGQAVLLAPLHELAVGDVGEDDLAFLGQPNGTLGELHPSGQFLYLGPGLYNGGGLDGECQSSEGRGE